MVINSGGSEGATPLEAQVLSATEGYRKMVDGTVALETG